MNILPNKKYIILIGLIILFVIGICYILFLNKNSNLTKKADFYEYICKNRGDLFGPFAGVYKKEGTPYGTILVCYHPSIPTINNKTFLSVQLDIGSIVENGKIKKPGITEGRTAELNDTVATFEDSYSLASDLRKDCIGIVKITFFQDKAVIEEIPKCTGDYSFAGIYFKDK